MGLVKDLYIDEVERLIQQYIDEGMDEADAYEKAADIAYESAADRLADMADAYRKQRKENG